MFKFFRFTISILTAFIAVHGILPGRVAADEKKVVIEGPDFRKDIAFTFSFGFNTCLGTGNDENNVEQWSHYAACNSPVDNNQRWRTRFGFSGGVFTRPFNMMSVGLDFLYSTLMRNMETENRWRDFTLGPVVRFHLPLKIKGLYVEQSVGFQTGMAIGIYDEEDEEMIAGKAYERHKHTGPFAAFILGSDVFLFSSLGLGIELRFYKTFYKEVCFEWDNDGSSGNYCRSTDEISDNVDDKRLTEFPWKFFFGIHVVYYL